MYIRENGFKSHIYQIRHVFRDDLGNIKGTKIVHGVQRVCRGIGKTINVLGIGIGANSYKIFMVKPNYRHL